MDLLPDRMPGRLKIPTIYSFISKSVLLVTFQVAVENISYTGLLLTGRVLFALILIH